MADKCLAKTSRSLCAGLKNLAFYGHPSRPKVIKVTKIKFFWRLNG